MSDQLADLDRRIVDALTTLRRARARSTDSPSAETRWHEALAARRLDQLLDLRPLCQLRQQAESLAG